MSHQLQAQRLKDPDSVLVIAVLVPESVCEGFFVKSICRTTSHLHLHIFASAHLHFHICTSTSLLIFTSSHLYIYIFTSAHLHFHIFTSAHIHLCSSSHLHICTSTSSQLHICTSHISASPRNRTANREPNRKGTSFNGTDTNRTGLKSSFCQTEPNRTV